MVVCKYFQLGNCRFGQNCRYEHVYSSKYSYQAPSADNVTDEQLVKQVQLDIQAALNGGQWILSCYSPFKEKACFPGLSDLSPEEARLIIYEAKANQTLDQAVTYMNNLFKETKYKYEQLLQPSAAIVKVLQSIYKREPVTSPFECRNQTNGSQATSLFRNAVNIDPYQKNSSGPTNSVFSRLGPQNSNTFSSAPKTLFAQAAQNTFGPSQPSNILQTKPQENAAAKSLFAQASKNVFGQQQQDTNIFATIQQQNGFTTNQQSQHIFATHKQPQNSLTANQNIFATSVQQQNDFAISPQQNTTNPFGIPMENQNENVFQQNVQTKAYSDIFRISKNVFEKTPDDDEDVYSKVEELSESDLEAYNSSEFKLGFIPELPPPHRLCV